MPNVNKSRFSRMFAGKSDRLSARERVEQALAESNPDLAAKEFAGDRKARAEIAANREREGQLEPRNPDDRER